MNVFYILQLSVISLYLSFWSFFFQKTRRWQKWIHIRRVIEWKLYVFTLLRRVFYSLFVCPHFPLWPILSTKEKIFATKKEEEKKLFEMFRYKRELLDWFPMYRECAEGRKIELPFSGLFSIFMPFELCHFFCVCACACDCIVFAVFWVHFLISRWKK